MAEQEKREESTEESAAPAEGGAEEAKKAEQAQAAGGDEKPSAQREERKAARPGAEAAPAGPPTAVVAPRRPPGQPVVSRRGILRLGFWSSLGALIAGVTAGSLDLIFPRGVTGFGGKVSAGDVSQYPPGSKTEIGDGRFWLVHLTEEQGGPGLLALWWKCPHLGCTVPWNDKFLWPDPTTGAPKQGWFRCPCHGSTYTDAGILVFGPAPRSLDTMELMVEGGRITVDTGKITPGGPDNPDRVVRV